MAKDVVHEKREIVTITVSQDFVEHYDKQGYTVGVKKKIFQLQKKLKSYKRVKERKGVINYGNSSWKRCSSSCWWNNIGNATGFTVDTTHDIVEDTALGSSMKSYLSW
jgi:hypothetical protein